MRTWPAHLLIVGCGNMGGAMLSGWLASGMPPERITIVDPVLAEAPPGIRLLRELPGSGTFGAVLLGVKPQTLAAVAPPLEPLVNGQTLVLSMLAGVRLATLAGHLPRARAVVRVMPNLAAAIGKSPIVLAGADVGSDDRAAIDALMQPLGSPEWLADEGLMDAVTALVGSGPAFVYRLIAALAQGAAQLGLGAEQAQRMALAMVEGAAALATRSGLSPDELARRVTSPGGTTAAGLRVLDEGEALTRLVAATLEAARDRGAELARPSG